MNRAIILAGAALIATMLSGCIAVHDGNGFHGDRESCSVKCGKGGRAEVSCQRPKVPACQCEPEVAAACVSARSEAPRSFL